MTRSPQIINPVVTRETEGGAPGSARAATHRLGGIIFLELADGGQRAALSAADGKKSRSSFLRVEPL
jgi:hypothetical protein